MHIYDLSKYLNKQKKIRVPVFLAAAAAYISLFSPSLPPSLCFSDSSDEYMF